MTELYQPVNHHERLIEQLGRPYIKNCPAVYEPLQNLVEAENRGEHVSEAEAFQTYFERMQERDPDYMLQITRMADNFETAFPEGVEGLANRRLQMVVPAYREGENMDNFLKVVKDQWDQSDQKDWGVTFVIDHAIPYKNGYETGARKQMQQAVDTFLKQNPEMKPYVNYVFYTRRKDTAEAVLPVGLARDGVEYYTDLKNDLGNFSEYQDFVVALKDIFTKGYAALNAGKYCSIIISDFTVNKKETCVQADIVRVMQEIGFIFCGTTVLLQRVKPLFPFGYPYAYKINHHHQNIINFRKPLADSGKSSK
jgi:hypothetical protein